MSLQKACYAHAIRFPPWDKCFHTMKGFDNRTITSLNKLQDQSDHKQKRNSGHTWQAMMSKFLQIQGGRVGEQKQRGSVLLAGRKSEPSEQNSNQTSSLEVAPSEHGSLRGMLCCRVTSNRVSCSLCLMHCLTLQPHLTCSTLWVSISILTLHHRLNVHSHEAASPKVIEPALTIFTLN